MTLSAKLSPVAAIAAFVTLTPTAHAETSLTIYNVTAAGASDSVPFENDGTPNRPIGDHLGNTITFVGTARYLTHVQVVFAAHGPVENDTYTLSLYRNDGKRDNLSGLSQPGTLIGTFQTVASDKPVPGNHAYGVDWSFAPTLVPDTLTVVVSSSYSTITPGQFMGPFTVVTSVITGSALNTIWYGDGKPGHWAANDQWAIKDGARQNRFDMRFDALPTAKPSL